MRNYFVSLLFLLIFVSCQVDIRQVPPSKQDSVSSIAKYPNQLYIGKFDIITHDRMRFVNSWRTVFIDHLKSARIFQKVSIPDLNSKITSEDYTIDVTITPLYSNTYNYWWTWPAIYPLTFYWPVQIRDHFYKVQLDYNLYQGSKLIAKNTITEEAETTIEIYGFFRTANVEKMIETTNLMVMEKSFRYLEGNLQAIQN
ncbi:hypothetical protein CH354_08745 [Leptospira levettii]|uniref:LBF_2127 family putative lipoprotein n=1 Tax=Leptospira levettii TaxID=2023178 RepID=UPI000C2A54A9|nr:hypothetical protein [Leptospira levettii]PJZ37178.1 hypothetical protein CH354_08745 [Leptospira levettii]PJZ88453.1 hypothetical protein CH368_11535 [Leptospira levettii]